MRVLMPTTWGTACGIAECAFYLKESIESADRSIEIEPSPEALDPAWPGYTELQYDLLHLNYQNAVHSRWTPDIIRAVRASGTPVLVTMHDTGVPNSDQVKGIVDAADAAVVHEPFDDLPAEKVRYWRMGVPDWGWHGLEFDRRPTSWCGARPVLGSVGFPFGWKNYDQLARVTAEVGWALYLIAPTATDEQVAAWTALNPHLWVRSEFVDRREVVTELSKCAATAFCYVCHNTGQSAAILQGIAARKPVIALETCRQFRALREDWLGQRTIRWADSFEMVAALLRILPIQRVDPSTVALAEQESWAKVGQRYASLYRELAGAER